jgi:hypothetical protein
MAAKTLTEKGIRCLMLNAGPVADVVKDTERKSAYELPYRGITPVASGIHSQVRGLTPLLRPRRQSFSPSACTETEDNDR